MSQHRAVSGTPSPQEWNPYHRQYLLRRLPGLPGNEGVLGGFEADATSYLEAQTRWIADLVRTVPPDRERHRYAPGKWSVREVVGHLADAERVLAYRALAASRGDRTNLMPFDEEAYVAQAGHDELPLARLVEDLLSVRAGTLALARSLTAEQWRRCGRTNGNPVSARAWMFVTGVHVDLHLQTVRERYLG